MQLFKTPLIPMNLSLIIKRKKKRDFENTLNKLPLEQSIDTAFVFY